MILIDSLNGVISARRELGVAAQADRLISVITRIEVLAGMKAGEELQLRTFLSRFTTLPISDEIAERAAALRRTSRLNLPHAVIYATAEVNGVQLITRNTRDFSVNDPIIRVPYLV